MLIELFLLICVIAFICEWIDSSLGMGYGTILSPLLLVFGFPALLVVPSILLTQAAGGLTASIFHHKCRNVCFDLKSKNIFVILKKIKEYGLIRSFKKGLSEDLKIVFIITSLGIFATILAVMLAITVSKTFLNTYIGILVIVMGLFMISGITFVYSLGKMLIVGVLSSFNKGLSGGGFGPVVTGGQIVLGQDHKKAIGCTTAAEFPICITAFIIYLATKGIGDWSLIFALGIGALLGGLIGPFTTKLINKKVLKIIVAVLLLVLGTLTLLTTYGFIAVKIGL